jgi:hypothetical protein
MFDDFRPYAFKSADLGRTWLDISGNLPDNAYIWVIREDPRNPNIIYAGTEVGLFISFTRGEHWVKLHLKNLPTVAVHDILIHPRENDIIIGTHGRSLWVLDNVSFLQEISSELIQQPGYMFTVRPALRHATMMTRYGIGDKVFKGENPSYGALITYYLKDRIDDNVDLRIEILDRARKVIRRIEKIPRNPGLNRVAWDLRMEPPRPRREEKIEQDFFFRGPVGPQVLPGAYTARLFIGQQSFEKPVDVRLDPTVNVPAEAIESQYSFSLRLREMQSYVNDGLRALDMVREQIIERRNFVSKHKDKFSEEVSEGIELYLSEIDTLLDFMVRPDGRPFWSEGPRLIERLGQLFEDIDGVNESPTQVQVEYFNQLKAESKSALDRVNSYLDDSAGELNKILRKHEVPQVFVPEKIEAEIH